MGVPICGPKLSICCTVISVWGVLQLTLMGIFLRIHSPAFFADMPIDEVRLSEEGESYVYDVYDQASTNCFIAAGMYVGVFVLSFVMWRINSKQNYMTA